MIIGNRERWWNHRVPIWRVTAVAVLALLTFNMWMTYGDAIQSAIWSISHRPVATFRGQILRLPWLWREDEWTNYNDFELSRSYIGTPVAAHVTVTYRSFTPDDIQKELDVEREWAAGLSKRLPGFYERDDQIDPEFICDDTRFGESTPLFVNCLSRDGRWNVRLIGLERSRRDFEIILREVDSMGSPSQ